MNDDADSESAGTAGAPPTASVAATSSVGKQNPASIRNDGNDAAAPTATMVALLTALQEMVTTMVRLEARGGAMEATHAVPVAPPQPPAVRAQGTHQPRAPDPAQQATPATVVQQLAPARPSVSPLGPVAARGVQAVIND
ncbi:hypothetical protein PI124_g13632 [Phytophthora idaei]|nr:hypothetical protein PI125_g20080 [Phytophthora idaei]KAG3130401.1 hypothetical protein PI126_g20521 [Phytophthora idaei]KAG3241505.1 hypothetical protein PI124_g13632 [Phytophthora idaei]